ncbi:hypothetical protein [Mycolicibacter arupensis]|jgi:hypothetical protein|uniref:hypothetical protein n=1 Tax=Mycolicibacter arupensis TaxID=342002 RepID=UPI00122D2D5E|nr:hypothetical protein [Mycolicibacter arupensis]KAA1432698.1 hypothetical protein F0402_01575 [Mycolicibacter arupensis]
MPDQVRALVISPDDDTRRSELIALASAFSDPRAYHPHPTDPALIPSWNKFLMAADVIAARYRADYDRGGPLCVIAEPTRVAALLHLAKAWTAVVDAHLDGQR